MNTTIVNIETKDGKVTQDTRQDFADAVTSLHDGWHKVVIQEVRKGYTATRYKYYFAHVLQTILMTAGHHFKVMNGNDIRNARNTDEIHDVLKLKYNPTIIKTPFGLYITANSTTSMPDSDFINAFEEAIIAEFSEPPYGCDFMGRDEWAAYMKQGKRLG